MLMSYLKRGGAINIANGNAITGSKYGVKAATCFNLFLAIAM